MDPREAIDHIQRLLGFLGLRGDSIERQNDDRLLVKRKIPNTNKSYKLFIWIEDAETITLESLAFKTAYGDMDNELIFYQQVLLCNNLLDAVSFRMTQMKPHREWGIMIGANIFSDEISVRRIKRTIESFDDAYTDIVPVLKSQATKMGLSFTGEIRGLPNQNILGLLEEGDS